MHAMRIKMMMRIVRIRIIGMRICYVLKLL
jgi:hypothetical protein